MKMAKKSNSQLLDEFVTGVLATYTLLWRFTCYVATTIFNAVGNMFEKEDKKNGRKKKPSKRVS